MVNRPSTLDNENITWRATLPCPRCGNMTVIGYKLENEFGEHMHTRYVCTFWRADPTTGLQHKESVTKPCEWSGSYVPGYDDPGYLAYVARARVRAIIGYKIGDNVYAPEDVAIIQASE